ncbi:MAG: DUF222 domain-containing protein, partial [Amnibacterium sp.]
MQAEAQLAEVVDLVAAAPCRPAVADDRQLLEEAEAWEALGRLVDARRVALAGEVAWRSRPQIGEASLARRQGERDAADLLARQLRIGRFEAKRRTALGLRVRSRLTLAGEEVPGRWPAVGEALAAGALGVEAARVIVEALGAVMRRVSPEDLEAAERQLVENAADTGPDLLREQIAPWLAYLDPDGAQPSAEEAHRNRGLQICREGKDGITTTTLKTAGEATALLRAVLEAGRRKVLFVRGAAEDCEDDTEWREADGDKRTRSQVDHDTVIAILRAGLRADAESASSTTVEPEVVVHVRAEDLAEGRGCGWADGIAARIPIPTVEKLQCAGSTRIVVTGEDGEPLYLGRRKRLFSRAQRRALAARDGGCAWPGCTAPVAWTEGHHIRWVKRDRGRTDIDNGVLLCSFHHHLIHATDEWEIRRHKG